MSADVNAKKPKTSSETAPKVAKAAAASSKASTSKVKAIESKAVKPQATGPKAAKGKIVVQQYASPIRRHKLQRLYLNSLGLGRISAVREIEDTPAIRGLLEKVAHMVKVISK